MKPSNEAIIAAALKEGDDGAAERGNYKALLRDENYDGESSSVFTVDPISSRELKDSSTLMITITPKLRYPLIIYIMLHQIKAFIVSDSDILLLSSTHL